jgi:hypothetical protein
LGKLGITLHKQYNGMASNDFLNFCLDIHIFFLN